MMMRGSCFSDGSVINENEMNDGFQLYRVIV